MMEQLTFWPETREETLEKEVIRLKEQCEKVRKSQFAKIASLTKQINELTDIVSILNASICKEQPQKMYFFGKEI